MALLTLSLTFSVLVNFLFQQIILVSPMSELLFSDLYFVPVNVCAMVYADQNPAVVFSTDVSSYELIFMVLSHNLCCTLAWREGVNFRFVSVCLYHIMV